MKAYRKPTGAYIELNDTTPVSDRLVEVAVRPTRNHVFSDTWTTAPMDPAVCWRLKTAPEITAEKTGELATFLATSGGKALLALVNVLIAKNVLTLAEVRAEYRNL